MWILVNLAMLVLATLIAGAAAVAVYWLLLRATVELMRPAALRPAPVRIESAVGSARLARETADLAGAFASGPSAEIRSSVEINEGSK